VFHILEIYKSLLPKDVSENYQSTRLQCKLASYYGSSITIQPQRGQDMSSIVFSSSLTIADAKIRLMPHPWKKFPELHFSLVFLVRSSKVFSLDCVIGP
jgi:hypothetical protein